MVVSNIYATNPCGPLWKSVSRTILDFRLDQVSTLVPYSNSQDTTERRSTRQLYLNDLGIDCDGNYNRSHLATQRAPVHGEDTRCNPFLSFQMDIKRLGYPYWKHCNVKDNKFGIFDPPYAVKPLNGLIPITATTAGPDKPKTTAASTKATAAPEPGPTKAEPSNPEPTKNTQEEEGEEPVPGKTEAEGQEPTAGGNGGGQGGNTVNEPGSEPEKTQTASPNTPSKDSNAGAGQNDPQPGSEAENTKGTSPSTPSEGPGVDAGENNGQPGSQGENTKPGTGSNPSNDSNDEAGNDGSQPAPQKENTEAGSGSTPSEGSDPGASQDDAQSGSEAESPGAATGSTPSKDSGSNADQNEPSSAEEDTKAGSGNTPSNDADAGGDAGQDGSEDADSSPAAPGSDEDSSSGDGQNNSNPKDGYYEADPTKYSGLVVSTMTGEQVVRLGTAGLEVVDVESGKTSTYAVPAVGVTDDQTTYAPATVAVYSGTTLTLGGPEITVTGAVVVAPPGSETTGIAKPTLAVVGSSSANKITNGALGLGVSLLLVLWI